MADLVETLSKELEAGISRERLYCRFDFLDRSFFNGLVDLLESETVPDSETYEPPLAYGPFIEDGKKRISFAASPFVRFDIQTPSSYFDDVFRQQFAHLPYREGATYRKRVQVDLVRRENDLWQLLFNGTEVGRAATEKSIPLILQENLIILAYQSAPYLMALHAGAVTSEAGTVVMPAESGSGKTTLTAALVQKGFSLYSDEIALLENDGKLTPLPFSLNIKEGSWEVLKGIGAEVEGPEFLRFDGQKVRYLPPLNLAEERKSPDILLFPAYKKGAKTSVQELSPVEALRRITSAGYQLHSHLDAPLFEALLEHLFRKPAYSITYDSLESAVGTVEELLVRKSS